MEEFILKNTLKGYVLGFLSAAILVSGITYAASTTTLYDVKANGIKIVVDGQKLNPVDANGNKVEPIIYNGTTYLPVRAVANALGKAVYWDGPNYTVYLGDMDGKLEYPTIELEDMTCINGKIEKTEKLTDNYGNRYSRAVFNGSYSTETEYLLNMKYSRFKATLYMPEKQRYSSNEPGYFKIIADGKTIYTSPEMTKSSRPIKIDVNVKGYNDIKLIFNRSDSFVVQMCLGDAGFYQ